jgi:hypothetical protein
MHPDHLTAMLRSLRPVLQDPAEAERRLRRYWTSRMALVWTVADVHRAANERELALTPAQARQVLQTLWQQHDPQLGLRWSDLTDHIETQALGRPLTRRELRRFVQRDLLTMARS